MELCTTLASLNVIPICFHLLVLKQAEKLTQMLNNSVELAMQDTHEWLQPAGACIVSAHNHHLLSDTMRQT